MNPQRWLIHPRDPLMLGDGPPVGATSIQRSAELPSPTALAGYARTRWLEAQGPITDLRVREALDELHVRGPWMVWEAEGIPRQPWVPAPAVLRMVPGEKVKDPPRDLKLHKLILARTGSKGGLGPDLPLLVQAPERWDQDRAVKLKPPKVRYLPLDLAIALALREDTFEHCLAPWLKLQTGRGPVSEELRTHVALHDDRGTAEDAQLFGTRGSRYHQDAAISFEVSGRDLPAPGSVDVLGGESRPSFRSASTERLWPDWAEQKHRYEAALSGRDPARLLLRLQLVTPGCFGLWRPRALDDLTLVAAAVPGFQAISGWNMKLGAPRAVRRLVPAGSAYWFRPREPGALLDLAKRFWDEPLPGIAPGPEEFLSKPEHDGYGQVLPGFELAPEGALS